MPLYGHPFVSGPVVDRCAARVAFNGAVCGHRQAEHIAVPDAPAAPETPESAPSRFLEPRFALFNNDGLLCQCGCGGMFRYWTHQHLAATFPACLAVELAGPSAMLAPVPVGLCWPMEHLPACPHREPMLDQFKAPPALIAQETAEATEARAAWATLYLSLAPRVGSRWIWEPDKPHARQLVTVTATNFNGEELWVEAQTERGTRHVNELSRWIESAVLVDPGE